MLFFVGLLSYGLGKGLDARIGAARCSPGYIERGGCEATRPIVEQRVHIEAFDVQVSAADFDAAGRSEPGTLHTDGFWADSHELHDAAEGQRATSMSLADARRRCRERGGRLPTSAEWLLMASFPKKSRYPWGDTGLLCRTAVWGRSAGPCARGARQEAPGAHADGCSPAGICDLIGNLAEWTEDGRLHGGSFASTFAGELRVAAFETPKQDDALPRAGARCVYDEAP